jgi:hypothetical protein
VSQYPKMEKQIFGRPLTHWDIRMGDIIFIWRVLLVNLRLQK